MAKVPAKHGRDQNLDFEGFLNNLQDWELSLKDDKKKQKSQSLGKEKMHPSTRRRGVRNADELSTSSGTNGRPLQLKEQTSKSSQKIGIVGEDRRPMEKTPSGNNSSSASRYDYLRNYDAVSNLSSGFMTDGSSIDANSEKELGNENFKQKKFKEAIDCYSRSIALSPTAVAYANRAMAYLKIKRYQEAEDDCTEALSLDDRYIKAYSRRSTARKELRKLKEAIEDAEFSLRLEPQNQEIKKQYAEAKSLYEKDILEKASGALKGSVQEVQRVGKPVTEINDHDHSVHSVSGGSQRMGVAAMEDHSKDIFNKASGALKGSVQDVQRAVKPVTEINGHDHSVQHVSGGSQRMDVAVMEEDRSKRNYKTGKGQLKASVQELAARAASLATAEAGKNITPPNSAHQFEVSWRGLSGDRTLQAQLLKVTSPAALPQIFKNALSAPILIDIVRCIATFFIEEMDLSVKYLESLTKVSRFEIIIMCLSSADKADLLKIWDDIFCNKGTPAEYAEILGRLRLRYCL